MTDFKKITKDIELKKDAPKSGKVSKDSKYVEAKYVSLVDIDTPFKSMVLYYFKWSFAVIPTLVFWAIVYWIIISVELSTVEKEFTTKQEHDNKEYEEKWCGEHQTYHKITDWGKYKCLGQR